MVALRTLTEERHEVAERFWKNANPVAARFWRRLAAEIGRKERLQPVPNKPHIPDDVILSFDLA